MTDDKPWLSLPDEDPPERGLAELMAAARAKAAVMVRPPWWKRAAGVMRRPPVLALATAVVLLGGVIVVRHHPEGQAPIATPPTHAEAVPVAAGSATAQVEAAPSPPPPPPPPVRHHPAKAVKAPPPEKEALELSDVESVQMQLHRCRVAATHKDCAGARACAKQLQDRDRSYYDANAANDATLRSCLETARPAP